MFRPRLRTPSGLGNALVQSLKATQKTTPMAAAATAAGSNRRLHHLPISRHNAQAGIPLLMSPEGFDLAWTQHTSLMLNRLDQLVAGTEFEERDLKSIVMATARSPHLAPIFNYASMAHNTDFFFKHINSGREPVGIPASLLAAIEDNFGSVETLRREFVATANGMFGPGFIWLVKSNQLVQTGRGGGSDTLRLLITYHAGSPYPGAHWRRQPVDMNTVNAEGGQERMPATNTSMAGAAQEFGKGGAAAATATAGAATPEAAVSKGAGAWWLSQQTHGIQGGTGSAAAAKSADLRPPGGIDVIPLLCLSTWEHVWLRDYGLGLNGEGGKAGFVDAWWDAVDWELVADMATLNRSRARK